MALLNKMLEVGEVIEDVVLVTLGLVQEALGGQMGTAAELVRGIGR